jgi:hypothetical protein
MDKKSKQRRQKAPTKDELADVNASATPPGASFDTEAGRAAQGMRPDLGGPADDATAVRPPAEEETRDTDERKRSPVEENE